jgi:hypothetical protein
MPRCCGGNSCACLIESAGAQISVTGSGAASDPYIIHGGVDLAVVDTSVFNLTLTGSGTTSVPWALQVDFASTAKLDDLPDVQAPAPTNAQVLGWDASLQRWTPRSPTVAASGSVQHDTSLSGDGSGGSPLQVNEDASGYLATGAGGLGLSNLGKNRIVRHFADSTARSAASPAPDLNALSMLDSVAGRIDYWNGSAWIEHGMFTPDYGSGQLLALSGAYSSAVKLRMVVRQVTATTDAGGVFDVLSTSDLSGRAGVLGCWFQPTESSVFSVILETATDRVRGHAYRLSDGSDHSAQNVSGVVLALVY